MRTRVLKMTAGTTSPSFLGVDHSGLAGRENADMVGEEDVKKRGEGWTTMRRPKLRICDLIDDERDWWKSL